MADQSLGTLYAELALKTNQLEDGTKKSTAYMRKLNSDIDKLTDDINHKLESIGKVLSIGVTAPLAILGVTATKTFMGFEQAMQNTYSVMGASREEMQLLSDTAEKMGAETRFSASQAANALYNLGSAGMNAKQSINGLDGVLKLAGATQSDLEFTSATLASTLSQFNLDASESARVADVYAQAISKSQANMNKLAFSMRYVGPIAAGMGQSLEGTTAALMALYNAGFQGEQAGTIMRGALTTLADQTDALDSKLAAVGLTYAEVNPQANSFADIIQNISSKTKNTADVIRIFGDVAGAGMAKLVSGGDEAIRTFDAMLLASDGAAAAMQKIQNTSLANTVDELSSAWEGLQIQLTGQFEPALNGVLESVTAVIRVLTDLPEGFQVAGVTALAFAAVAGPVLVVAVNIKKLKNEMVALNLVMTKNPFMLWATVGAAAIAVVAGVVTAVKKAQEEYDAFSKKLLDNATKLTEEAMGASSKGNAVNDLLSKYESLKGRVGESAEAQKEYNEVVKELQSILPGVTTQTDEYGNAVITNIEILKNAVKESREIALEKARLAEIEFKAVERTAKKTIEKYSKEKAAVEEKLDLLRIEQARAEEILSAREAEYNEFKRLSELKKRGIAMTSEEVAQLQKMEAIQRATQGSFEAEYKKAETSYNSINRQLIKQTDAVSEVNLKLQDQNDILAQGIANREKLNALKNPAVQIVDEKKLLSQAEAIERTRKEYKEQADQIEKNAAEAKLYGNEFNASAEKAKVLEAEIRKLLGLQAGIDIDATVTTNNPEVQELLSMLRQLKTEAKLVKDGLSTDTSQGGRLAALNKEYGAMVESARRLGKDTYSIEQEWYAKRLSLLESFVQEDAAKGLSAAQSLTSVLKGTGMTLEDWIKSTKASLSTEMQKLIHEYQVNTVQLEDAQRELSSIDAQLMIPDQVLPDSTIAQLRLRKDELKKIIDDLRAALGQTVEVENPFAVDFQNAVNVGDIKAAESALKPYINSLKKSQMEVVAGTDAWTEYQKEIDTASEKIQGMYADQAKAFTDIAVPAGQIGQVMADSIAAGITDGGAAGLGALVTNSGSIMSSLGTLFKNQMLVGVGGAVTSGFSMLMTVINAVKSQQDQATAEAERALTEKWDAIRDYANDVAGDIAATTAKAMGNSAVTKESVKEYLLTESEVNKQKKFLDEIGNYTMLTTKEVVEEGHNGWVFTGPDYAPWLSGYYGWIETTYKYIDHGTNEILKNIADAENSTSKTAAGQTLEFWEKAFADGLEKAAAEFGVSLTPALGTYVEGLESTLTDYIKGNLTFSEMQDAVKDKVKDAVLSYLTETMLLSQVTSKITDAFKDDDDTPGKITAAEMAEIVEAATTTAESIQTEWKDAMSGMVGSSEQAGSKITGWLESMADEWQSLGDSIASSLTDSLGDAAMEADWASFRNAFTSQLKKAVIQSAVNTAGLNEKVQSLISGIMDDGKVTTAELNAGILELKDWYGELESALAPLSTALGQIAGADIEATTSGTIINQMSGADRDFLAESIQEALSGVTQNLNFEGAAIQHINATTLIINSLTYNHSGNIYIQASEETDLRALMGELVEQALGSK